MKFKLKQLTGLVLLALGAASSFAVPADTAFVYYNSSEAPMVGNIQTNLGNALTSSGYATTLTNDSDALPTLTAFKQVWDIRGGSAYALTDPQKSSYLSYLQGGGTLFLMGENTGYGPARNASLISFITAAGGGTPVIGSALNSQTVQAPVATTPNTLSTVSYAGAGGFTSTGNGICLTKDNNNSCTAVAFGGGTLSNATAGALVSVLDVNFLGTGYINTAFVDNLIAYLAVANQPSAPTTTFVPVSNRITGGVGATLDGVLAASVVDVDMAAAVGSLSSLSDSQRAIAMNRLTPAANNSLARLGSGAMMAGLSSIAGRLEGIRNAGALAWAEPDNKKMTLAAAGPMTGLLEMKELRHGVWGKIFGGETRQDAKDGFAGYKANTWGMTLGADTRLDQGTVVGGAFTYAATNLDQRDFLSGSGNDLQNFQLTGYTNHDFGIWYLEGLLSYGQQRYKSHRNTNVTGVAKANYDGDMLAARASAGRPFVVGEKLVVTPFASMEYNRMTQDSYQENGAGPLNLRVNEASAERVRSGVGVRLAGETNWGSSQVRPSVHVQWLHDYKNDGISTTSTFTGGGAAFATPGQKIARDTGNIGGSLLFSVAKNAALSVHYDYEGASGFSNQTGQVIGQWWF